MSNFGQNRPAITRTACEELTLTDVSKHLLEREMFEINVIEKNETPSVHRFCGQCYGFQDNGIKRCACARIVTYLYVSYLVSILC